MKPALLIIDMQYAWLNDQTKGSIDSALVTIKHILEFFRKHKLPVYFIQHENKSLGVVAGSDEFRILDAIIPKENEIVIKKTYGNAFNKTNLSSLLQEDGVDTLILTGYRAENCVLSTYRGALDLDLFPIVLKNAIASPDAKAVDFIESISEIISLKALIQLLS
jgi:nicotinamidase-related amidase